MSVVAQLDRAFNSIDLGSRPNDTHHTKPYGIFITFLRRWTYISIDTLNGENQYITLMIVLLCKQEFVKYVERYK